MSLIAEKIYFSSLYCYKNCKKNLYNRKIYYTLIYCKILLFFVNFKIAVDSGSNPHRIILTRESSPRSSFFFITLSFHSFVLFFKPLPKYPSPFISFISRWIFHIYIYNIHFIHIIYINISNLLCIL